VPRRRTARRLGRASVLAALVLLCTACTAVPPAPSASASLPEGIGVRIFQNRFDYAERMLEIAVSNDGPSAFALVSASVSSPQFTDAARYAESVNLAPGMTRNLRVRLADPVCAGRRTGPATVTLRWAVEGGGTASATVTPLDDTGALERISGEDCLVAAVDSVVTITPAERLRIEGAEGPAGASGAAASAWLDVTLTPTGEAGAVTIDRVGDTTLLAPVTGTDWPVGLTIEADSPRQTISLEFRPARCDSHAVAEDKRGTVLPIAVGPDAGPAGTYNLSVGDALRGEIYAWITARCGG
jgi:hypothetical protein